jgi:hypothetical protein
MESTADVRAIGERVPKKVPNCPFLTPSEGPSGHLRGPQVPRIRQLIGRS